MRLPVGMADIFGAGGHVREASARVFLAAKRQAFARSSRRITKLKLKQVMGFSAQEKTRPAPPHRVSLRPHG